MVSTEQVPRPRIAIARAPARRGSAAHEKARAGEDRYRMVAEAAYFRAERRGFVPGAELEDWLAAEIEVEELLAESRPR